MMTGFIQDQQHLEKQIERQMGCMSGFLHIFDRHQSFSGRRSHSPKRLLHSPISIPASPEPVVSNSKELNKPELIKSAAVNASPDRFYKSPSAGTRSVPETPPKSPLPLPIFEGSRTSWKFSPRLSLDSRAIVDAKGSIHSIIRKDNNRCNDEEDKRRSPSVIARLMGLEPLPNDSSPVKKPELRRSNSESRVSRDLFHSRLVVEGNSSQHKHKNVVVKDNVAKPDPVRKNAKPEPQKVSVSTWKTPQQRKSFYDATDIFPEPKQTMTISALSPIYGEIEKRLRIRGIDEQTNDLETLKQILEALQLKGLLHSNKIPDHHRNGRNFVYDKHSDDSPIVLMKPRRERPSNDWNISPVRGRISSPTRESKGPNPIVKKKPMSIETQRRAKETAEQQRRVSPVNSPKVRRSGSDQTITNRSPRNRKLNAGVNSKEKINIVTEDESSSISGRSTVSTCSERSKIEEYREGRTLLERCDKLLHSIAEMNSSNLQQPSPVSVLDSSFFETSSSSPSPVTKRSIEFKDGSAELDDEVWSPAMSPANSSKCEEENISNDSDFIYISEILHALRNLPEVSDIFSLLEKQQYLKGRDTSKVAELQRKLIYDTIAEILDRKDQLPPWKALSSRDAKKPSVRQVWLEYQKIRDRGQESGNDDLLELICGVLRKDLVGINGWENHHTEISESVLDIERLIFKDLVSETIHEVAEYAGTSSSLVSRRKLVF